MKSEVQVTLYGDIRNNAVVKLPGRANPGIVIQGDSLEGIVLQVKDAFGLLNSGDVTSAREELAELISYLEDMVLVFKYELQNA